MAVDTSTSFTTYLKTKGTARHKLSSTEPVIMINHKEYKEFGASYNVNETSLVHLVTQHTQIEDEICQLFTPYKILLSKSNKQLKKSEPTKIPIEANTGDVKKLTQKSSPECKRGEKMTWNNYHRLSVIHNFMDELERDYPALCTTGIIGQSLERRNIKILKISNSNACNVSVWIDAGIHAREWIGPAVNTFVANYIACNFKSLPQSMRNKDWYFLPVANPDGYEYSHTSCRMWRKNKAVINDQVCGVDLNRNFSYGWGGKGSSSEPSHAFYRGPKPFSEPESIAIRNLFCQSGLIFKVYITLHSYGQMIIMPYACSDTLAPDYITLLQGATIMSRAIFSTNGNIYKVGISKDVLYRASGTSNDWSHGVMGIPFCYLIELRSKKSKFQLPEDEITETGLEILNCLEALMEFIDSFENTKNVEPCQVLIPNNSLNNEEDCKCMSTECGDQAVNIWFEDNYSMDVMVHRSKASLVASMLHTRDMPFSIAVTDVRALWEAEQGFYNVYVFGFRSTITESKMSWTNYHGLDTIYAFMDNLAAEYPYLCSVSVIGRTVEARDLKILKISDGRENNEGVWLDGAIHAREWISPAVVTYIADQIVRNFNNFPDCITKKDWYILPVFNPDGYEYSHTTDRMWRKNRSVHGASHGVDLNRNWSVGWAAKGEEGSSKQPGNSFFRGPKAFSEEETKAVKHTILDSSTKFKVFLSLHSYGEAILFPWGYTSEPCPDYITLLEGGTVISKAIFETNGHLYKVGSTKDLMYYASGTSVDWAYQSAKIPFTYMIELRGKKYKFLLPKEKILPTSQEILNGVIRLLEYIDKLPNTRAS